jgi:hypothetical protein
MPEVERLDALIGCANCFSVPSPVVSPQVTVGVKRAEFLASLWGSLNLTYQRIKAPLESHVGNNMRSLLANEGEKIKYRKGVKNRIHFSKNMV